MTFFPYDYTGYISFEADKMYLIEIMVLNLKFLKAKSVSEHLKYI